MSSPSRSRGVQDSGWAVFAGVLFVLAGIFHVMWGIAGITNDDNFVSDELLFGDLTLWGSSTSSSGRCSWPPRG